MSEATLRLAFFFALLVVLALCEWRWPRHRAPAQSQTTLTLGLDDFRGDADQRFPALLVQPLRNPEA